MYLSSVCMICELGCVECMCRELVYRGSYSKKFLEEYLKLIFIVKCYFFIWKVFYKKYKIIRDFKIIFY